MIWQLVERGALTFNDRVADHVPEFARHGKGEITLFQVLTHQGGYPSARVTPEAWADHGLLRQQVCDFTLEWTPGSRMHYHGESAHWTAAVVIEAVTGRDYRAVIRDSSRPDRAAGSRRGRSGIRAGALCRHARAR